PPLRAARRPSGGACGGAHDRGRGRSVRGRTPPRTRPLPTAPGRANRRTGSAPSRRRIGPSPPPFPVRSRGGSGCAPARNNRSSHRRSGGRVGGQARGEGTAEELVEDAGEAVGPVRDDPVHPPP